jgi:septum formation protein
MTFRVIPSDADETVVPGETAQEMVRRLSLKKAQAVASALETPGDNAWVIGADSTVVLDGKIIGKPDDPEDARRMLAELSGTRHQVTTGVTVVDVASGRFITDCLTGDIAMRELSYDEIAESVATGTPMDKAGAYAIQDDDLKPGELVDGCFTNVVGLPLCRLLEMLDELGCPRPPAWVAPPQPRCRTGCPFSGNSPTGKSPGKGSERSSGRGSGG